MHSCKKKGLKNITMQKLGKSCNVGTQPEQLDCSLQTLSVKAAFRCRSLNIIVVKYSAKLETEYLSARINVQNESFDFSWISILIAGAKSTVFKKELEKQKNNININKITCELIAKKIQEPFGMNKF